MGILERYQAYADAFEQSYEDDDWSRIEQYFTEDAVYEGEPDARGRDAVLAKLKGGEATPNSGTGSCLVECGDGRVGWADLDFLSGPKLKSIYHAPSVAGRVHKEEFGVSRKARWFGL